MSPKRRKAAGRKPARAGRPKAKGPRPKAKSKAKARARKARPPRRVPKRRAIRETSRAKATPKPLRESIAAAAPESVAGVERVEEQALYRVRKGAHVFVTVDVDAAQKGQVSLFLDQTLLGRFTAPVPSHDLGLADDLLRKLLTVDALVSDVSTKTDALQIRVTLTGGPEAKTVQADTEAPGPGGSAQFRIFVLLKE
jgi:hypothetical protein